MDSLCTVIAAYPCLGKTTLYHLNKESIIDSEFNESRSTKNMNEQQKDAFFSACADIIELRIQSNACTVLFITEDDRLLEKLRKRNIKPVLIFPDAYDIKYMKEYKEKVIARSGCAWWNRVIEPEIYNLIRRIKMYKGMGYDVRLTNSQYPYIENVIDIHAILEEADICNKESVIESAIHTS